MPRATTILTAAAVIWLITASPAPGQARTYPDLSGAVEAARDLDQLHSMLVSWRGELVLEHYAPKIARDRPANIKSASKSVISTLVGLALARGLLRGVDEPIATYLPQLARAPAEKRRITIEDLLTMRAGLESTSGRNYGAWVRSRNWVQYALERPLVSEPGTTMAYSTGTSHILSAIVTRVSRTSTWQFAQQALAKPLGFSLAQWTRDPQGIYLGGNEMLMTPRQMVAFGELYLNRGRMKGRQILPARWVDESCRPRTRSAWDPTREYGYGWWIQDIGRYRACFAWGFGGQYIFTFRDLDLVVVVTSSTASDEERHGYRRRLFRLIAEHVLEPIAAQGQRTRGLQELNTTPGIVSIAGVDAAAETQGRSGRIVPRIPVVIVAVAGVLGHAPVLGLPQLERIQGPPERPIPSRRVGMLVC